MTRPNDLFTEIMMANMRPIGGSTNCNRNRWLSGATCPDLTEYYLLMDELILASEAGKRMDYHPNARWEIPLEQLDSGSALLDQSLAKAGHDEPLKRRIDAGIRDTEWHHVAWQYS